MRIRTDSDYAYRRDAIERAVDFYDFNKTKAAVSACDDVPEFVQAARQVLEARTFPLSSAARSQDAIGTSDDVQG